MGERGALGYVAEFVTGQPEEAHPARKAVGLVGNLATVAIAAFLADDMYRYARRGGR